MNTVRLTLFGAGVGLVFGFAIRATLELRQTKTSLANLSSQRAAIRGKIAQGEERLRAANVAAMESKQEVASPREEPESTRNASGAASTANPLSAQPKAAVRDDNPFAVILNDPNRRAVYLADYRAGLDWTLGGRFKALGLSPAMIEKVKDIAVEDRLGWLDFRAVADAHGLDWNSEGREALREKQQKLGQAKIADVLGPELNRRWRDYGATQNVRDFVQRLASTGSYLDTPMTSAQVERTNAILVANGTPREANRFRGFVINWENANVQLREVLTPAQIGTLGLFVQEQEAGAKVSQRIKHLTAQFQGKQRPD